MTTTKLPSTTEYNYFYWKNCSLVHGLTADSTDDTVYFSAQPLNDNGDIIDGNILAATTNKDNETELIWIPSGEVSVDGYSATNVIRGISPYGDDFTTGSADFIYAHRAGQKVVCSVAPQIPTMLVEALQGLIATGGSAFIIGTDAAGTVTIKRSSGTGTSLGFIRHNNSSGKVEYSNDGSSWNSIDSVTSSNLIVVTGSDTTPSNLQSKTSSGTGVTRSVLNPGANEQLEIATSYTATPTEINQVNHGVSANVTATNLNTLTAGESSNADSLHTHVSPKVSGTALEAINGATTPQAIAILGNNYRRGLIINGTGNVVFKGSGCTARNIGDADATTREAQSFSFTDALATTIKLENLTALIEKVAAPVDNLYVEIQTDSAGSPSGTAVTNGTSAVINGASISTTRLPVQFTWATPPTLTSGTTYWFVLRRDGGNDAVNYYTVYDAGASTYSSNTAKRYKASTTAWTDLTVDLQAVLRFKCDYDGKVVKSDSDDMLRAKFSGFTRSNVSAGGTLSYTPNGIANGFSGLSEATTQYLSTTAGSITSTTPAIVSTPGSIASYVEVGRAITADQIVVKPVHIHVIDSITGIGGSDLIETGTTTGTLDLLIETGFQPREFEIKYQINNVGGTATDDRFVVTKFIGTIQVSKMYVSATSGTTFVSVSNATMNQISIQAVYENGYLLRSTAGDASESISNLSITAIN